MDTSRGFSRILLATDGSEQAAAAVDATIELARFSSATVRVIHIWNLDVLQRDGHWEVEDRREARDLVNATVDRLTSAGLVAEGEVFRADSGHVATSIATVAREFSADLVVLGSRGLSDWQSMFRHSVSHKVLSVVDCPVLVVRGRPAGSAAKVHRILLAVAGGEDVAAAVKAAVGAASARVSTVMVVHVDQAIFGAQGFAYVESDEEIRDTMAAAIGLLRASGIEAEGLVARSGPVAKAIAEIATNWNADVIVVNSSRMGDLASMLVGSVSHDLLHISDRPVLIAERKRS
jgi:nucleotide-binding universal stress UspA family protein